MMLQQQERNKFGFEYQGRRGITLLEMVLVTALLSTLFAGSLKLFQGLQASSDASVEQRRSLRRIELLAMDWQTAVTTAKEFEIASDGESMRCTDEQRQETVFVWEHGDEKSFVQRTRTDDSSTPVRYEQYVLKENDQVQWRRDGNRIELRIQDGRFENVSYQVEVWIDETS